MTVCSLGYVIVEATDLVAWRRFADTLGLMEGAATARDRLHLRIDERPFRIAVRAGQGDRFVAAGWEFANQEEWEACIAGLKAVRIEVTYMSQAEADERCVSGLARCQDPAGNTLELYWGRVLDYIPFASPRGVSGFVTGDEGMGHVVLPAPLLEACRSFYKQQLAFGDTDEMWLDMTGNPQDPPLGIRFLHAANPRHHSLALMGANVPGGCVHMMLQAQTIDDVGRALDRCQAAGMHISSTLGRHSNDQMLSFYVRTPGGFDIEFGCEGVQVADWSKWVPTRSLAPDLWGHRWAPPPSALAG